MARGKIAGRKGEKLLDTWYYQYVGVPKEVEANSPLDNDDDEARVIEPEDDDEIRKALWAQAGQVKVAINLYLHKKFEDSVTPPMATKEVWFSLKCEKPEFEVTGADIECLRVAMWEKLDAHFAIKWERYFKVQITPGYSGYGLNFEYTSVEKGTAWDGTLLLREFEYRNGRVIRPWPGEFRDGQGRVPACIPDTPENQRALEEFGARIHDLRRKLADFLRPDVIMNTLSNLSSIALLSSSSNSSKHDDGEFS